MRIINGVELGAEPAPTTPTDAASLVGIDRGRIVPAAGVAGALPAPLMLDPIRGQRWWITPRVAGSAWDQWNVNPFNSVGTATAKARSTTNAYTKSFGVEALVTVAATTAVAGGRINGAVIYRGAVAGEGGFLVETTWGVATGTSVSTRRAFCGVAASVAAPTDAEPSAQTNIIGMGWDAADTQVQIMHNNGSGTATKVALGANFPRPAVDRQEIYRLTLWCAPNDTSVSYRVERLHTGDVASGTLSTDLPVNTTFLTPLRLYTSVGGTSGVTGCLLVGHYGEAL